jgi:hypothetical protein
VKRIEAFEGNMIRWIAAVLVSLVVTLSVAPSFAQSGERFEVAQQERRKTLFDLLFGPAETKQAPVQTERPPARRPAPTAALPPPKPQVEKNADATRLAVFGDSLAIDLSRALERFYAEDPNLAVFGQGVSSSGFVRDDYFDWTRAITDQIVADSFDVAVFFIGINDRQELKAGAVSYAPLTDEWVAAYQGRISHVLGLLRQANKPVIWIGLPPMQKTDYSAAISRISNVQRIASFSSGAEFLDIFERFLGEDGKYAADGPDVNGQVARMRKDDGIHLSAAGSDKLAFYLDQTLKSFYRGGSVSVALVDPLLGTDAAVMMRPPFQGLGQARLLEVAGAVVPISRVPARASDLIVAPPVSQSALPFSLDQLVNAPIGRADAFGVGIDPKAEAEENAGR